MKNKDVFLKTLIVLTSIIIILIIILALLGRKERVGYLSDLNLDIDNTLEINGLSISKTKKLFTIDDKLDETAITNYIFSNNTITNYKYGFKIKYYSKVFRNSDIYGVYPNIDNILNNNSFIKEIKIGESGSPFGYLISSKILNIEKIDDINYILKLKYKIILLPFIILFTIFLFFIIFIYRCNIYLIIIKIKNILLKKRNLILKIYNILVIVIIISFIIIVLLGKKERMGYLSDFIINIDKTLELNNFTNIAEIKDLFTVNNKLDYDAITNYIFTNNSITNYNYNFRVKYYSKVFRNSDIYGVYPNFKNLPKYIELIKMNDNIGTPFGNFISTKILNIEKIDNINYILKIRKILLIFIFIVCISVIFVNLRNNFVISILFILLLALSTRIFWAYQQDLMYWDEWHSLTFLNKGVWDNSSYIKEYVNIKGFDILKDLTIDDSSIKDCVDDIVRLYKNTNDPFISNLYYTLLRLSFIGREVVDIKNIIVTGTILNSIFFIVSFIFLYKILKLIFAEKNDYIIFSLLIMSLSPISISFSMFLRPYQLQETFFVIITFFVIDTIYNNKYSIKNFIITTFIAGIGYLTLYSSMLFVLILSAMLFINYIFSFKQLQKNYLFKPLIEINSYKTIIYYAVSFISALFISRLLYASFFSSLFNANNRAANSLKFSAHLFNYINDLSFNGLLIILFILIIAYFILLFINDKTLNITIDKDKFKLLIFIILVGLIYAILGDFSSPFKLERYSASSYILILFLYPLIFSIFYNKKIRYILFLIISLIYIHNITTPNRFSYFEKIDKSQLVLTENIPVYAYDTFFNHYGFKYEYLNTNLNYTYINDYDTLSKISNDKFYLLINTNDYQYELFTNDIFTNKISKLNTIFNTLILKIEKSNIVE